MQVQLTFRQIHPSYEIEKQVFGEVAKIDRQFPQLLSWCHVVVEKPHRRRRHGEPYSVRVAAQGTAGFFVATSTHGTDADREMLHVAISEAFQALRSQLQSRVKHDAKLSSKDRGAVLTTP